ncbi:DUF5681 domain-containing protein [Sphingomonas sp. RT2P30]|uniref:DUF5681 domain-containing protein n=1 Tax=Parasphingomonas halimpatiens TaxID=3096162 RepID=UPI002FCC4D41
MPSDESESRHDRSADSASDHGSAAAPGPRSADGRFRKGVSGNPAGRKDWRQRSGGPGDRLLGADEPTRAMILAEAYRIVRLKEDGSFADDAEGDGMPAAQAVLRAMTRAALSGSRLAQHRWTQLVREAEREQRAAQVVIYNALEREHYRRNPKASYDDDLIFDTTNGAVVVRGDGDAG